MVNVEVSKELIKKVAENARLNLSEEELEKFVPQIKEVILESFNKLDELEVNEPPSFQPIEQKNKMRKDLPLPSIPVDDALKNVSQKLREETYIKGPKAL
jgi:aspartyl-tRNA(Asn)/glutamyl-tRNA(Gln) amidotransferase subunit C